MRIHLWAAAFAAVAGALPSRRSEIDPDDNLQYICELGGQTLENWEKLDMGFFLNATSMMWCENEDKCPEGEYTMSFVESLASLLPDKSQFNCVVGQDECNIPTDAEWCTSQSYAQYWFALNACRNLHDHINSIIDALDYAQQSYATKQVSFVQRFTEHDLSAGNEGVIAGTIAAGFFAVASVLLGPLAPVGISASVAASGGAAAGLLGGGATVSAGTSLALSKNVAEVIQREIDNLGDMGQALEKGFSSTRFAIRELGGKALNDVPPNTDISLGYSYKDDPLGAPALLNPGTFAEPIEWRDIQYRELNMMQIVSAAAISYLWRNDGQIYIAKLTEPVYYQYPCDIELTDLWRVCDGDTAYFYLPWSEIGPWDDDWSAPPGIEYVEDEGLDLVQMAKAAEDTQKQYGYDYEWNTETAIDAFMSETPPPYGLLVNLPVCFLDRLMVESREFYDARTSTCDAQCQIKNMLNDACQVIPLDDSNWPYELHVNTKYAVPYVNEDI